MSSHHHYGGSSVEDGGLHHRRTGSKSSSSKLPSRPQLVQRQVSNSKTKDHDGGTSQLSSWLSRQNYKLLYTFPRLKKLKGVHLLIAALTIIFVFYRIAASNASANIASSMHCSSFLRSFDQKSRSNIILMASHLRHGPDGEMRLRIIEHNLQLLAEQVEEEEEPHQKEEAEEQKNNDNELSSSSTKNSSSKAKPPLKAVLLFSIDTQSTQSDVKTMINNWRQDMPNAHLAYNIISQIIFVPNDPTMVDASKWIVAIERLLPEIQSTNARVMLINDSFVLTRNVPELWHDDCGDVCGLVWTASEADESRHIQSYIRTLSSCAAERYRNFYYQKKSDIRNVHELIVEFELNLSWVGGGRGGGVSAIYEYAGAHPDDEAAQKVLIPQGYPAIKLKKFFVTDDPWLSEPETTRSKLPPSFSATIYKRMNHDLNYLSDEDAKKHFAVDGKNEDRIYSSLPLVIKSWLREELIKMGGEETTIAILEAYLAALNRGIVNTSIKKV